MCPQDVELVRRYRDGDEAAFAALLDRHGGLIHSIAREYFIQGAAPDDTHQEARLGFYKAVRDYDLQHPFASFAALCVRRQVLSAVKLASAKKHTLLTAYEPIENVEEPNAPDPEPFDDDLALEPLLALLTPMERRIMEHRLAGCSDYSDLAEATGYSTKAIDNALCRSRRKIKQALAA
jgi:RNA polymerase sporulation-specific sigma factor